MAVHEIARRLIGGVWRTVDVEEDGGGNGGSQAVLVATKHLTTAEILALHTVAVAVVAAAGAGKIIVPVHGFIQLNAGATPFDFAPGGNLDLNAAGTETAAGFINSNYGIDFPGDGLNSATDVGWGTKDHGSDIFPIDQATLANKGLTIMAEAAAPSQGNGTADITVLYYVADAA